MAKTKRLFVDGPYGQIHARMKRPETQEQPPLVCLHMFPQSSRNFSKFIETSKNDRIIVALDFPGHGESDAPLSPIKAADYAKAMWVAIDELGLLEKSGCIDFFGIHAGAKLTVEMAAQRPNDVRKLVLSSAAILYPPEVEALRKSFAPIPLDAAGTRFQHIWELITKNRPNYMTLDVCADQFAEILRGGEKYEWGHAAVFDYNLVFPDVLNSIDHSVALLNPHDELQEMTLRSLDHLKNVDLIDLPHWGHGFVESFPEEVVDLVLGWLDQDDASSTTIESATAKTFAV